jgi:type IV pilus biogenesis protein PilP
MSAGHTIQINRGQLVRANRLPFKAVLGVLTLILSTSMAMAQTPPVAGGQQPTQAPARPLPPPGAPVDLRSSEPVLRQMQGMANQRINQATQTMPSLTIPNIPNAQAQQALPNVDVTEYKSELDEFAAISRSQRILDAKLKQAETIVKLYDVLFPRMAGGTGGQPGSQGGGPGQAPGPPGQPAQAPAAGMTPQQQETFNQMQTVMQAQMQQLQQAVAALGQANARIERLEAVKAEIDRKREIDRLEMPIVNSVSGTGSALRATILVPQHGEVRVSRGEILPNGMRVASIDRTTVVVDRGGERIILPFGADAPRSRQAAAAAAQVPVAVRPPTPQIGVGVPQNGGVPMPIMGAAPPR